jgi:cell division protein FtsB
MRWVIALFAFALAALQLEYWFDDNARPGLTTNRRLVAEQTATNQALIERNADLQAEILNLKQGSDAAEERARFTLGLIQPDEIFFQIAETEDPRARE